MIHSLGSVNFLKIEKTNHILFACQYYDDRQVCIQEQYKDQCGQTNFTDIFRIKIWEITLRELMLLQSLFASKSVSEVERLVKAQPNPRIFLKVFLELGYKSMIPYISFDMRSIANILNEKNTEYFDKKFPIFYAGEDGNSPIDIALENDQIRSVNLMINYVVQYQNNYVYQFLFLKNFVDLLNKGITLTPLL